jgi:hypothetical protein
VVVVVVTAMSDPSRGQAIGLDGDENETVVAAQR